MKDIKEYKDQISINIATDWFLFIALSSLKDREKKYFINVPIGSNTKNRHFKFTVLHFLNIIKERKDKDIFENNGLRNVGRR